MNKKACFLLLFIPMVFPCEMRKRLRDADEVLSSKKYKCNDQGKTFSNESREWENGFVAGILDGWFLLESEVLPCGCKLANKFILLQFYHLFKPCVIEVSYDKVKIIRLLMDAIMMSGLLIDSAREGKVDFNCLSFLEKNERVAIEPILTNYNSQVRFFNELHHHQFESLNNLSYYS